LWFFVPEHFDRPVAGHFWLYHPGSVVADLWWWFLVLIRGQQVAWVSLQQLLIYAHENL